MLRNPHFVSDRSRKHRGVAAVEFGLAFIAFMVLMTGLVELGRGVWAFNTLAHATRQGARYAQAQGRANSGVEDTVRTQVQTRVRNAAVGLEAGQITVTTTWPNGIQPGNFVSVQASYPFRTFTGALVLEQSAITLRASARVPIMN